MFLFFKNNLIYYMSSTGNEIIDDRYNTYVPYNWRQQVSNAFSTAISYTWTAIQTFTNGIKTNDIFCETAGAVQATLFSDVGFGRDVIIGNTLSNTLFNNISALTANSGCNILLNQVGGIGTLCDAPTRTALIKYLTRGTTPTLINTIKIGSAGNTTTEMEGTTKIVRLKSTYLDTFVNSEDVVLYSENLTGYVKIADAPTRSGGVNIFSKGTTPSANTIKIGANSATTTELDGITKISNPLFLDYTSSSTIGTLGYVITDPSTSSIVLSTTFATIRTITLTAGTWIITGSVSENNASGTEVGGVVLLYNNTASANIRVVYDEFPVYAYSTAPIVTFLYLSVSSVIELRASLNAVRTGVSALE
jgi:hypothetical protein